MLILRKSTLHFSLKRSKDEGEGDGNEIDKKINRLQKQNNSARA